MPNRRCVLCAVACLLLASGCAPLTRLTFDSPAMVHTMATRAGLIDRRTEFRAEFCGLLAAHDDPAMRDCSQWLQRFSDEPALPQASTPARAPLPPSVDIVIVSGIFSECLPDVEAYADGTARLEEAGYVISRARVKGRASSEFNAAIIRDHIAERRRQSPDRPVLIVGYSKGISDTITALATYPELGDSVAAVLGFAGVVNGSPAADKLEGMYNATVAHVPYRACPVVDGGELHSLTRHYRLGWLASHALPAKPLYFSIVGVPDRERVSTVFHQFHRAMSAMEPRNDGQMLYYDAVLPGSRLLGYVNADHFAIALPFISASANYRRIGIDQNNFPRGAMLQAAVRLVEQELQGREPAR